MPDSNDLLLEEIQKLFLEPVIGSGYGNTYGEVNLINLVAKYRSLNADQMRRMSEILVDFSTSTDLASSYISVGVLHALGMTEQVEAAYAWAATQDEGQSIASHFDIGRSLADHFIGG